MCQINVLGAATKTLGAQIIFLTFPMCRFDRKKEDVPKRFLKTTFPFAFHRVLQDFWLNGTLKLPANWWDQKVVQWNLNWVDPILSRHLLHVSSGHQLKSQNFLLMITVKLTWIHQNLQTCNKRWLQGLFTSEGSAKTLTLLSDVMHQSIETPTLWVPGKGRG